MSLVRALLLKHGHYSDRYEIIDLSYYYLADEISRDQFAMDELISRRQWKMIASMTRPAFVKFLRATASTMSLARYGRYPRGDTTPNPKRRFTGSHHTIAQKTSRSTRMLALHG